MVFLLVCSVVSEKCMLLIGRCIDLLTGSSIPGTTLSQQQQGAVGTTSCTPLKNPKSVTSVGNCSGNHRKLRVT